MHHHRTITVLSLTSVAIVYCIQLTRQLNDNLTIIQRLYNDYLTTGKSCIGYDIRQPGAAELALAQAIRIQNNLDDS